jgi:hypothetical protein
VFSNEYFFQEKEHDFLLRKTLYWVFCLRNGTIASWHYAVKFLQCVGTKFHKMMLMKINCLCIISVHCISFKCNYSLIKYWYCFYLIAVIVSNLCLLPLSFCLCLCSEKLWKVVSKSDWKKETTLNLMMTMWLANCHQAWLVRMSNREMGCVKITVFESSVPVKVSCTVCCSSSHTSGSEYWRFCLCFSYKCHSFFVNQLWICGYSGFWNLNRLCLKLCFELYTAFFKFWLFLSQLSLSKWKWRTCLIFMYS